MKFIYLVSLDINCIFVSKCSNEGAFFLFSNHFKLIAGIHSYCTKLISNGLIFKRLHNTVSYGNKSIISSTVITWNQFQTIFPGYNLFNMSPKSIKSLTSSFLKAMTKSLWGFTIIVNIFNFIANISFT